MQIFTCYLHVPPVTCSCQIQCMTAKFLNASDGHEPMLMLRLSALEFLFQFADGHDAIIEISTLLLRVPLCLFSERSLYVLGLIEILMAFKFAINTVCC